MSRKHEQVNEKRKGMKILGIVLIILLIIILGVGVGGYWYVNDKLGKMQHVTIDENQLKIDEQVEENLSEYRNIAIFALDSRENEYDKGNRSDGIIVVSINKLQSSTIVCSTSSTFITQCHLIFFLIR